MVWLAVKSNVHKYQTATDLLRHLMTWIKAFTCHMQDKLTEPALTRSNAVAEHFSSDTVEMQLDVGYITIIWRFPHQSLIVDL